MSDQELRDAATRAVEAAQRRVAETETAYHAAASAQANAAGRPTAELQAHHTAVRQAFFEWQSAIAGYGQALESRGELEERLAREHNGTAR